MADRPLPASPPPAALFGRVITILEQARTTIVRTVNTQMVAAYWLIGREIVEEEQQGQDRAEYGARVIEELSRKLRERYGNGFSMSNLEGFRKFCLTHANRQPQIPSTVCGELGPGIAGKGHTVKDPVVLEFLGLPKSQKLSDGHAIADLATDRSGHGHQQLVPKDVPGITPKQEVFRAGS